MSLSDQLELFRDYKRKLKAKVGEKRAEKIVAESIYVVCSGTNDIANTYFLGPFRRPYYDVQAYTDLMADSAMKFLQVRFLHFHKMNEADFLHNIFFPFTVSKL